MLLSQGQPQLPCVPGPSHLGQVRLCFPASWLEGWHHPPEAMPRTVHGPLLLSSVPAAPRPPGRTGRGGGLWPAGPVGTAAAGLSGGLSSPGPGPRVIVRPIVSALFSCVQPPASTPPPFGSPRSPFWLISTVISRAQLRFLPLRPRALSVPAAAEINPHPEQSRGDLLQVEAPCFPAD